MDRLHSTPLTFILEGLLNIRRVRVESTTFSADELMLIIMLARSCVWDNFLFYPWTVDIMFLSWWQWKSNGCIMLPKVHNNGHMHAEWMWQINGKGTLLTGNNVQRMWSSACSNWQHLLWEDGSETLGLRRFKVHARNVTLRSMYGAGDGRGEGRQGLIADVGGAGSDLKVRVRTWTSR